MSSLPAVVAGAHEPVLEQIADRLEAGEAEAIADAPVPRLDFLRWLAGSRPVLFHGSSRDDLGVLEPIRLSQDTTEFGNRQAVYATSDPVWALYFAILRRDARFATRNASIGIAGEGVYPRWYFFSVSGPLDPGVRFGPGSLYLLPRAPFEPQPPFLGGIDTAQWVSSDSVRPLARVDVSPSDFPFLDGVVAFGPREPVPVTIVRAAARNRRG